MPPCKALNITSGLLTLTTSAILCILVELTLTALTSNSIFLSASIQLAAVELDTSFSSETPPCNTKTLEIFFGLTILVKLISSNPDYLPFKHNSIFFINCFPNMLS